MQATHFWNQLHLRRNQVIVIFLLSFGLSGTTWAQGLFGLTSTSGSDDKTLSYGFFLAVHQASYQLRYSDQFLAQDPTDPNLIYSIYPKFTPGFSLGFMGILRFHDQVNLLFTPKIGFYEYRVDVNYADPTFTNVPK